MKKYLIPIGMGSGALIGLLFGLIINFGAALMACAGAALGIIAGAAGQLMINYMYPDSYFIRRKRKESVPDSSLFSEKDIAAREALSKDHLYKDRKAVEDDDSETGYAEPQRRKKEYMWEEQTAPIKQRSFEQTQRQPSVTRSTRQESPQTRATGQIPPQTRATGQIPPQTRATGQIPPQTRATGQIPPQTRATRPIPPQARATGQMPPQARATGQMQPQVRSRNPATGAPPKVPEKRHSIFDEPDSRQATKGKRRIVVEEDDD